MVLLCQRLVSREIYLQGAVSFALPKQHVAIKLYCSPHNLGSLEVTDELKQMFPGLLQVVNDLGSCDCMLVYLNARTWTHHAERLEADIVEARRRNVALQLCHEFPSAIDSGGARQALDFKDIMNATPPDLQRWPGNIYVKIAVAMKGGAMREVGLINLAKALTANPEGGTSNLKRANSISVLRGALGVRGSRNSTQVTSTEVSHV